MLDLAVSGTNLFAGTNSGVFLSTNNGTTWSAVNSGLPTNTLVNSFAVSGTNLFASTWAGVFLSTNNGSEWTQVNLGLPLDTGISTLAVCGTNLFAGTYGSSVWSRSLSEMITVVEDQSNEIPSGFVLQQNYPNPFNPSTNIKYQIPNINHVTLKVYNVLGREVRTLVNENLRGGSYEATFDASGLASGVYLYRLQAGEFTQTRRLLLLR